MTPLCNNIEVVLNGQFLWIYTFCHMHNTVCKCTFYSIVYIHIVTLRNTNVLLQWNSESYKQIYKPILWKRRNFTNGHSLNNEPQHTESSTAIERGAVADNRKSTIGLLSIGWLPYICTNLWHFSPHFGWNTKNDDDDKKKKKKQNKFHCTKTNFAQ